MHRACRVAAGKVRRARRIRDSAVLIFQHDGGGGLSPARRLTRVVCTRTAPSFLLSPPLPSTMNSTSRIVSDIYYSSWVLPALSSVAGSAFRAARAIYTYIHRAPTYHPFYRSPVPAITVDVSRLNKNARFSLFRCTSEPTRCRNS